MKKKITIFKGPGTFKRRSTDANGKQLYEQKLLKEVVAATENTEEVPAVYEDVLTKPIFEDVPYNEEQFFITDEKSGWFVDEEHIKIEKITDELSGEFYYNVYQLGNLLVQAKELDRKNF